MDVSNLFGLLGNYTNGNSTLVSEARFENFTREMISTLQALEEDHQDQLRGLREVSWSELACMCGCTMTTIYIMWKCIRRICTRYRRPGGSSHGHDDDSDGDDDFREVHQSEEDDEEGADEEQPSGVTHQNNPPPPPPGAGSVILNGFRQLRNWGSSYNVQAAENAHQGEGQARYNVRDDPDEILVQRAAAITARQVDHEQRIADLARRVNTALDMGLRSPPPTRNTSGWRNGLNGPHYYSTSTSPSDSPDWRADAVQVAAQSDLPPRRKLIKASSASPTHGRTRSPPPLPAPRKRSYSYSNTKTGNLWCIGEEECHAADKVVENVAKIYGTAKKLARKRVYAKID